MKSWTYYDFINWIKNGSPNKEVKNIDIFTDSDDSWNDEDQNFKKLDEETNKCCDFIFKGKL